MLSRYFERAKRSAEARRRAAGERERKAREVLPMLVRMLTEAFGTRRVVLIGSLAEHRFGPESDVDLLVEGLTFSQALEAAERATETLGMWVDIVRAESLSESWRRYHLRYGEPLHG